MNIKFYHRIAFTLAEVLIVLGIIGVVAEMTIPTLMNNFQDQVFKTSYKKAYSLAAQAVLQCSADNSFMERTGWTDATNNTANWNAFMAKFKVVKTCDGGSTPLSQCWDITGEQFNNSSAPVNANPGFVDASGMAWVQGSSNGYSTITGDVFVDTNGFKKPNKFGHDRFRIYFVTADGAIATPGLPIKVKSDPDFVNSDPTYCKYPPCYYTSWLLGAK